MLPLRSLSLPNASPPDVFPFTLPVVQTWVTPLEFTTPVTFFVGENGSGKSTLLEALACAADMTTAGREQASRDASLDSVRRLGDAMRLSWSKRTRRGFFLRAEDFIGYVRENEASRAEMEAEIRRVDEDYRGRSEYAKSLAKLPFAGQLHDMQKRYGEGLDKRSHGQQFLDFFQNRFVPGGLYLLDEPEAPLSPMRQLGMLALLKEMVAKDAQFIIATHAPILMAFPGATILSFDHPPVRPVAYDDLEHVNITRDFLNNPERFLQYL
ncbi:MAG: AAA family ATPase [Anaerolineales bacterium]|nr:AAA family ATPase [Anaerolineales bacterium]